MATADAVQQLPADTEVAGALPRRVVMLATKELASRAAIEWERGEDELGRYSAAVVAPGQGLPTIALQRHDDAADDRIVVFADHQTAEDDLDRALIALGVEETEIAPVRSRDDEQTPIDELTKRVAD